ncbi:MAG: sigma-70 family RNA polymerase sigma factor [Clostridia bacterium]|nr:sigma-70 family RNA polymerase sigma factor [Clostridia bacterium]
MEGMGELLHRARAGDADAFAELCMPFSGMVYRHCLHMLERPADAEDAAQETMLRAYRSISRFAGSSGVATWLFRIAHNTCLDMYRKPQRRKENVSVEQLREAGFEPEASLENPEDHYLRNADSQQLLAAIAKLPQDQRLLLNLRYGQGMSYEELARATGLRDGTVKSKLNRAKARLHVLLQ